MDCNKKGCELLAGKYYVESITTNNLIEQLESLIKEYKKLSSLGCFLLKWIKNKNPPNKESKLITKKINDHPSKIFNIFFYYLNII